MCIRYPDEDVPYVLKTGLIHLLPKFHGLAGEDPHKHLKEFHIVCSTMKPPDVQEDHIFLKAFPHSLEGVAKDWLYYLAPRSITSWDDLKSPDEDVPYVLKTGLIHLLPKFHGLAGEDPHKHLKEFHIVCSTMKPPDVQEDHIFLKAFPHSLEGVAKDWLYYLAPRSITSWDDLKRVFLEKIFPASRTTTIRKDISGIRQLSGESLYEY